MHEKLISLIQQHSDQEPQIWTLPLPLSIGRDRYNQLVLSHKKISRHHARIRLHNNVVIVEDRQSRNGVSVNGRKIAESPLQDGDALQLGPFTFQFSVEPLPAQVGLVRCSNPDCERLLLRTHLDCPWCGFSLALAATQPYHAGHQPSHK